MSGMRIAIPLLIIVVVIVSHVVVGRVTQRRAADKLARVASWKSLPTEERLLAHTEFTEDLICSDADRTRNAVTFCLSVAAAGLLMIVWLDDNTSQVTAAAEQTNRQATENCRNFRTLVQLLSDEYTTDIRDLTLFLEGDPEAAFRRLPGYDELDDATRKVISGLAAGQVIEAQDELKIVRNRADIIRDFEDGLNCPS